MYSSCTQLYGSCLQISVSFVYTGKTLCLFKHHALITTKLHECQWLASRLDRLKPCDISSHNHCIEICWVEKQVCPLGVDPWIFGLPARGIFSLILTSVVKWSVNVGTNKHNIVSVLCKGHCVELQQKMQRSAGMRSEIKVIFCCKTYRFVSLMSVERAENRGLVFCVTGCSRSEFTSFFSIRLPLTIILQNYRHSDTVLNGNEV